MNLSTKLPKKRRAKNGQKRAKIAENRSKSASNYVGRISETFRYGLFKQNGEKKSAFYDTGQQSLRIFLSPLLSANNQI